MKRRFDKAKSEDSSNKTGRTKNKTQKLINKLLNKNKEMAENNEEKQQTQQKNKQSQEQQTEQTQNCEQKEENKQENWEEKFEELNKKYLLLYSDFENFRKRKAKEQMELVMNAAESTIKDLLPVIDDYERALQNMESSEDEIFVKTKEGLELIYNKLMSTLSKQGLKPINAKGELFDENLHEAIARIPAQNDQDKGKVMDETTKGYYLNDKVIRYSKVVVAM